MSESQSTQQPAGTTQRVAALREDCLIRDHHRCVISRKFGDAEAAKRVGREGDDKAKDGDGHLLKDEAGTFAPLEAVVSVTEVNLARYRGPSRARSRGE
jgi:hypothetical protein